MKQHTSEHVIIPARSQSYLTEEGRPTLNWVVPPHGQSSRLDKTGKGESQLSTRIQGSLLSGLPREECLQEPLKPMDINQNSKTQSQILKIEFLRYFFKTTETYLYIGLCICFSFFPLLSCIKESSFPKFLQGPSPVPFIRVSPRAPCLEAFSRNSCRVHSVHPRGKEASEKVLRCRLVEKPETGAQRKLQRGLMNTALKSRFWKNAKL